MYQLEKESQKNANKRQEREQRLKELEDRYAKVLQELDTEIDEWQTRIENGTDAEESARKPKPKPIVIEPMSQPLLSIDFADDLFTENTTKEKTFDFFDDDY